MAPRQAIDFNTVNRLAAQHQNMQQQLPQIQQGSYYASQNIPSTSYQPTINNPSITNGMSRISNITNNTTHTMNSTNNRYQVKN
jgi:hypothetical protein